MSDVVWEIYDPRDFYDFSKNLADEKKSLWLYHAKKSNIWKGGLICTSNLYHFDFGG